MRSKEVNDHSILLSSRGSLTLKHFKTINASQKSVICSKISRSGFTLIEMMIVITIMGMITAAVVLRTGGMTQKSRQEWALTRVESIDQLLRNYSNRKSLISSIRIELGSANFSHSFTNDPQNESSFNLGSGIQVFQYLTKLEETNTGSITVQYSCQGTTPTFALQIGHSENDSVWLLFSGMTGQITRWKTQDEVETVFNTI